MNKEELRQAIQHPLHQRYADASKQFEPALLETLARDAAGDAAYLPLLQVTLDDLWNRGSLTLAAYGTLTDAIQRRAEDVYRARPQRQMRVRSNVRQRHKPPLPSPASLPHNRNNGKSKTLILRCCWRCSQIV